MTMGEGIGVIFEVVLDVSDLDRSSAFWSAILGATETYRGDPYLALRVDDRTLLMLQKVLESHSAKNRMHFDLVVPDIDQALEQVVGLGGRLVDAHEDWVARSIIVADPDGNEFCLGTAAGWSFIKG